MSKFEDNGGTTNAMFWDKSESSLRFNDNIKIEIGNSDDLQIYHTGVYSLISNTTGDLVIRNTGNTYLQSDNEIIIGDVGNDEKFIRCINDGSVELYYNNLKSFYTTPYGAIVQGYEGNGGILEIHADEGDDNADKWRFVSESGAAQLSIGNYSTGSWVNSLTISDSNNATFAGSVSDSKGDLRSIPQNAQSSAYTAVAADAGKHIKASGNVTLPAATMTTGDAITIVNETGSDISIVQGTSLNLYNTADASTGNRTLAGRGMATVLYVGANNAYISGAGLSHTEVIKHVHSNDAAWNGCSCYEDLR